MKPPSFATAARFLVLGLLAACSSLKSTHSLGPGVEARSFSGEDLLRPAFSAEATLSMERNLALAQREHALRPNDEMAAIWHGRRLAYLGHYGQALEVYDEALQQHPSSFKLLRHRGHLYITLRRLDQALADLERASTLTRRWPDQYEPDGAPNPAGIARSTTRSNIEYHLGLARYLDGRFADARKAWKRCIFLSQVNDDMLVATTYWYVLTLWRLGRWDEVPPLLGPIRLEMDILENHDYHRLLLFYKGILTEGDIITELWQDGMGNATLAFGMGAWNLAQGRKEEARALFSEVLKRTSWTSFGHIAAEAELAR